MQIRLNNVSFSYENSSLALENVNFEYDKKDILALIGPNGGGKSTLLRLILGLLKPSLGEVKTSATLGYVPQFSPLNTSFAPTLFDVVLMGRLGKKIFYSKEDKQIAKECIKDVGLEGLENAKITALSGGQKQRAFIARALACRAEILLLDEPTASLDPKNSAQIYELFLELNKQGIGVILASHDTAILRFFADKIAFVNKKIHMHENKRVSVDFKELQASEHFCEVELASLACCCSHE